MKTTRLLLWFIAAFVTAFAADAPAQVRHFHPEKFERATKTDSEGYVQWAEHEKVRCPTCQGTGKMKCKICERYPEEATKCPGCDRNEAKEAVCHACAGTGSFLDPLEHSVCPGCQGGARIICGSCPGSGILKLGTGAKRWSNCIGCRGDGHIECPICKGTRTATGAKLKPSLRDAPSDQLKKAMASADATLKAVTAFKPKAKNTRKEIKELLKAAKLGEKTFPPIKEFPKLVKELMKMTYAGSNYMGQAERELHAMERLKNSLDYYLMVQQRAMELALKRAEANEKLAAEKGK